MPRLRASGGRGRSVRAVFCAAPWTRGFRPFQARSCLCGDAIELVATVAILEHEVARERGPAAGPVHDNPLDVVTGENAFALGDGRGGIEEEEARGSLPLRVVLARVEGDV